MLDILTKLLERKALRYINSTRLKELDPELQAKIIAATPFLEEGHRLQERIFCLVNGITTHQACKNCGKQIHAWRSGKETKDHYLGKFCSLVCCKTFYYTTIKTLPFENFYSREELVTRIKEKGFKYHSHDEKIVRSCFWWMNSLGIDIKDRQSIECMYFMTTGLDAIPKCKTCGIKEVSFYTDHYVDFCSSTCNLKSPQTKERREKTCLKKYGHRNAFGSEEAIAKSRKVKNNNCYDGIVKRFIEFSVPDFTKEEYTGHEDFKLYRWKCLSCNKIFMNAYTSSPPLCPVCYPGTAIEGKIIKFLSDSGVELKKKDRKMISPLELDVYIPDKNIAIELNGNWWHCEVAQSKSRNYHLDKTEKCEEKGIRLIQIFEDEILNKLPIVKARLKNILGLTKRTIYARKCEIKEITSLQKYRFLRKYHIQGNDQSKVHLGAFYKNRLVAVMTFGKLRAATGQHHIEGHWELSRFCTIASFHITGIAGKLLKHFERNYSPKVITSYADRRWSQGGLYKNLGFTLDHFSPPNYWYYKGAATRYHRYGFRKNVLKDKLENFDPALSEWVNMQNNGFDRIWDCGNYVFKKIYNT